MNTNYISDICGKIVINEFIMNGTEDALNIDMRLLCSNTEFVLRFSKVSALSIKDIFFPMEIVGFEILNNESKGWESASRYTINDYEYGQIFFHCEKICIVETTKMS